MVLLVFKNTNSFLIEALYLLIFVSFVKNLTLPLFESELNKLLNDFQQATFLLAVSGGVDSMVLMNLFHQLKLDFQIAHINYKLRGEASDKDQKLVENFCKNHQIIYHTYEVSEKDQKPENSTQLWARDLRYRFFNSIIKEQNLDYLVTAHHLNDQLETFIINLSRGSGLNGLCGIPANDNQILRPFLSFSKDKIYRFAQDNQIEFREDATNQKADYLRNKIRLEIVPQLLETNQHFLENFNKSLDYLNQTKDFVETQVSEIQRKITLDENADGFILDKKLLAEQSAFVQFEILRQFGFNQEEEIKKIFTAQNGSSFFSKGFHLMINRNELILNSIQEKEKENPEEEIIIAKNLSELKEKNFLIHLSNFINTNEFPQLKWQLDADLLQFPLKLRHAQNGDYFLPIGMIGKKTISKFFRDEKLSILARQKIWLLADGNNSILGVIPLRQDKRFAAKTDTKTVLTLSI